MRQNQDYKNEALSALSGNWPQALIASIILFITGALYVGADGADSVFTVQTFPTYIQYGSPLLLYLLLLPLSVGFCNSLRCLLETGDGRITNNMFSIAFGNWLHLVGGMIVMNIYILLWTLLLIIPGIIKAYSYSMTQFILVEHPELSINQAIKESRRLMEGRKFDYFWLQLSFIGWAILSILTLGIGFLWLMPYSTAAAASFYADVKAEKGGISGSDTIEGERVL